ncbi:MAG: hypothetical protein KQH67_03410 [Bacteroidetes bacterium]|nr:hypothetical protein [Bacteroidota bacterium]
MVILANKNIPAQALQQLSLYGELILLQTENITYPAISGHPDIFICPIDEQLVIAPNLPETIKNEFITLKLEFTEGYEPVGVKYPETAKYNCVVTHDFLIGNTYFIDKKILELISGKEVIHVKQGYTRCNLLALSHNRFITSDKRIEKILTEKGLGTLYVNPKDIQLPGFDHGFISGTAGIFKNQVYFLGNLNYFLEGDKIRDFLSGYEIIELYNGPLLDVGSIFFI